MGINFDLEESLLELIKQQRTRLQGRLRRIKADDGTYFGEGEDKRVTKAIELANSLIEVFGA